MNLPALLLGLAAVAGNVLGVWFLREVPSPYRPGDVGAWLAGTHAHPGATLASAWSFVVGLVALAAFASVMTSATRPERPALARAGWALVAYGALLNAAGCVTPAVVAGFVAPPPDAAGVAVGKALLAITLHLDAAFNLLLGLGLLAVNAGLGKASGWPLWLRLLGAAAGLASLPVFLQWRADAYADLLAISGPLWLTWFVVVSVRAGLGRT
ncbi:MAG: hypothetical protein U0229_13755 [Anaeromyxobacter sp.]